MSKNWPLWEVFIRAKNGLSHRHAGSVHAADAKMALEAARDTYTRRMEGVSLWVVPSAADRGERSRRCGGTVRACGRQGLSPPDLLLDPRQREEHLMSERFFHCACGWATTR